MQTCQSLCKCIPLCTLLCTCWTVLHLTISCVCVHALVGLITEHPSVYHKSQMYFSYFFSNLCWCPHVLRNYTLLYTRKKIQYKRWCINPSYTIIRLKILIIYMFSTLPRCLLHHRFLQTNHKHDRHLITEINFEFLVNTAFPSAKRSFIAISL